MRARIPGSFHLEDGGPTQRGERPAGSDLMAAESAATGPPQHHGAGLRAANLPGGTAAP